MNALAGIFQGLKSMLQWWVVIAPWEAAVRVRRGKRVKVLGAGMHLRVPLVDRFFVQSTRLRITDLPIQTLTTTDGATITLKGQLAYRIVDIGKLYDTLHDAEGTLVNATQAAIAGVVTAADRESCSPGEIGRAVTERLSGWLWAYGLNSVAVTITPGPARQSGPLLRAPVHGAGDPHPARDGPARPEGGDAAERATPPSVSATEV